MAKNWQEAQNSIHMLYVTQHQPLLRVRDWMSVNYGFYASIRSYRAKLKEWGYLRHEASKRRSDLQQQTSTAESNGSNSVPNILHHPAAGTPGVISDFDPFSSPALNPSPMLGDPEIWTHTSPNQSALQNSVIARYTSYPVVQTSVSLAYPLLAGYRDGDLNVQDDSGRTLLHQAVISRSLNDVEKYISMGASVDIPDNEGNQPIHSAASKGHLDIIRLLLKNGADPKAKGHLGKTPLHMSVRFVKAVKVILTSYPRVSSQDDNGDTPLHLALSSSKLNERPKGSAIEILVLAGANVNIRNAARITSFHMVLQASRSKGEHHAAFVVLFLENDADVFLQTENGRLPFEVFLENIESRWLDYRPSPPSRLRNLDLKLFINKNANPDNVLKSGDTFLNTVIRQNTLLDQRDYELGELLCHTVDPNRAGLNGNHALHCMMGKAYLYTESTVVNFTKEFLQRGVNLNGANYAGESPLLVLLRSSNDKITMIVANMLLERGANLMQRDLKGNLPIYFAARGLNITLREELLKLLLDSRWVGHQDGLLESIPQASIPQDQEWWEIYHHFIRQPHWSNPSHLLETADLMPEDVAKVISTTALTITATTFLESAKASFYSLKETPDSHRQDIRYQAEQIVEILRDCEALKIEVDQNWYHFLLDLFD